MESLHGRYAHAITVYALTSQQTDLWADQKQGGQSSVDKLHQLCPCNMQLKHALTAGTDSMQLELAVKQHFGEYATFSKREVHHG